MPAYARLSDADVVDIRVAAIERGEKSWVLADRYGVAPGYIRRLVRGEQRRDAGGPVRNLADDLPARERQHRAGFREANIEALPDMVAAAAEDELPIVLTRDTPLEPHAQRLMDCLGVKVEVRDVKMIDAQTLTTTHDCLEPGCHHAAEGASTHCRHHSALGRPVHVPTRDIEDLPAADPPAIPSPTGEDQQQTAAAGGGEKTRRPPIPWTRESAITAVQNATASIGHPPTFGDYATRKDLPLPSQPTAKKLFGGWSDMIVAAGFERPTTSTRYARAPAQSTLAERAPDGSGSDEARSAGVLEAPPNVDLTELRERAVRVIDDLFDALQRAFPTSEGAPDDDS